MAPKANLTKKENISATVREIDFATRFGLNWQALMEILEISRPIPKQPGTKLASYTASVTLQSGNVGEGESVQYSQATVEPVVYADLTLEKYKKGVSVEAIDKYGAPIAIQKTDDAFLVELQNLVLDRFYDFAETGTLVGTEATFQMAVAMAIGKVVDKFKSMRRNFSNVVCFVNTLDAYRYLGGANITIQTTNGVQYIKNFLGARTIILSSEIPQGKVIATPAENIVLYYCDPSNSDYEAAGLEFTTAGVTRLIGVHVEGNYDTYVGEMAALMGMVLWAEYQDGIAVITIDANPLKGITLTPESGATSLWGTPVSSIQENITITGNSISGKLKKLTSGQLVTDWGEGYFICVNWGTSLDPTTTSFKCGIVPSQGSGMQEAIGDPDHSMVVKVFDKNRQDLMFIQSNATHSLTETFDLSGLTLE